MDHANNTEILLESHSKELCKIMCRFEVHNEGQIISSNIAKLTSKNSQSKQRGKNIDQYLSNHI